MAGMLHHIAFGVKEYDFYIRFFEEVFDMKITRTTGEAPNRQVWFDGGVQLKEIPEAETLGTAHDHMAFAVADIPGTVDKAVALGGGRLEKGAHWFTMPNGVVIELMQA